MACCETPFFYSVIWKKLQRLRNLIPFAVCYKAGLTLALPCFLQPKKKWLINEIVSLRVRDIPKLRFFEAKNQGFPD
jgi:hypothetical protein